GAHGPVGGAARNGGGARGFHLAFRTRGIVGMPPGGLGLLGASIVLLRYNGHAPTVLEGFGFGGALLAMFMRVGGGIFTKAADVGADLVGKVEAGIPEDDPRNAATIADNVGDNVGDCAGMAADLFESYAVTLVAALILGTSAFGLKGLLFPLIVPAIGVVTAVIGVYVTRARAGEPGLRAINRSFYISAAISAVACTVAAFLYLPNNFGGLTGVTQIDGQPTAGGSGSPAVIATVAVIIAMDTFGPVSDNAQGIAEMSGDVEGEGVAILTELDAVGNTTKAITKGIAIATAVLAATALFGSYRDAIRSAAENLN